MACAYPSEALLNAMPAKNWAYAICSRAYISFPFLTAARRFELISSMAFNAQASVMGVFLHGFAGDLAAEELSQEYMSAVDIIRFLAPAFQSLSKGRG